MKVSKLSRVSANTVTGSAQRADALRGFELKRAISPKIGFGESGVHSATFNVVEGNVLLLTDSNEVEPLSKLCAFSYVRQQM